MSLDSITRSINNFLAESKRPDIDSAANWQKLRSTFLEYANKKIVLEPTAEISELVNQIHSTKGFGDILTDIHINKVFPSFKFKFHLVKAPQEPTHAIKIRAPTVAPPKSARPKSIDTPSMTLKPRNQAPKTARFKTTRIDPDDTEPMRPFPDTLPQPPPKITELIPNLRVDDETEKLLDEASTPRKRWIHDFVLNNERDAIKYVAAVDSKNDFLQFHFGTHNRKDPFQFQVENQLRGKSGENFNTVTKRGVFTGEVTGHSEFTDLHQYVENKTQYEMLKPISLFAQFRLYKYYHYWRLQTIKKLFMSRLYRFADACWASKPQYPPVVIDFRRHLLTLRAMILFPLKTTGGELEFIAVERTLAEARDDTYKIISKVSSEIRVILNNLSAQLNEYYDYITSPRVTDYLEMKRIPAELFMASKMPFKRSQSIVEAKELKKKHEEVVAFAKQDLDALSPFLLMCDKMVIQLFLEIILAQFKDFVTVFTNEAHETLMRTFLVYESETLMFNPSYREMTLMFNEHLDSLFDLFRSFIRPCMIDPKGSGHFLDFKMLKIRLDNAIKADTNFSSSFDSLFEMFDLAYKEAKETYNTYYAPAMAVFKFKENWEELKRTETDPTIYINNLTELTKLQEQITTFKNTYTHQFLICDTKQLRSTLLDILSSTIEENNTILFRNFEQICKGIATEINQLMLTLQDPADTLEAQAEFNSSINKAVSALPSIEKNVDIVNSIFARANECAKLLVPILEASLEEMREAYSRFKVTLELAQQKMANARAQTIASLVEKQKELEEQMSVLEKRTKAEFATVEVTSSPETAISDLTVALDKIEDLSAEVKKFENTATRLNYSDFDFSQIGKTRNELEQNLGNWKTYQDFMNELNSYIDMLTMEADYAKLINFLNSHNEREMRSANHPLFDKMANAFQNIYQYLPFFNLLTKIELNEEHWTEIGKILEFSYEKLLETKLKKFLSPKIITNLEQVKSYILNLQQRADLSQSFDGMILDMRAMILRLTNSSVTKMKIVTFPSIHEAMNTCEHFVLYLHSLENSSFFATIQQQVEFWMTRLKLSLNVLNAISLFQTKFVYLCTATVASFYETHFPVEYHLMKFIIDFYNSFISQLEYDPHVLSLIPNSDEQLKSEIDQAHKVPPELVEKYIDSIFRRKNGRNIDPTTAQATSHPIVNKDLNLPITIGEIPVFQGDPLIQCLDEARTRCDILLQNTAHLLDLHRQKFPRFYFCTDQQILEILLACSNIKFLTDDLQYIFPSLSRFHVSIVDTARVMGIINTNGETFQFSRDFDYDNLSVVDLLSRTENEMKFSVRSTILDALSSREYTEPGKWLIRFPLQATMVAESAFFQANISEMVHKASSKPDFAPCIEEVNEFIKCANEYVSEFPAKMEQVTAFISMKLKHRDILQEFSAMESISVDGFDWKKHLFHVVQKDKGCDQIYTQIGNFLIPYGYEMLSRIDIGLMTPQEEEAALSFASCITQPEFVLCKQLSGNRNIVKAFADLCGFPVFDVPSKCIRNVFAGASALHAVVRLKEIKELPAIFPNFFGLIEARMKIMKCESHFRDFDRNNWCCMIHIDEEKVPSWLKQRLRPIHLNFEPPSEILVRLNQIRREFIFTEDTSINFATHSIQQLRGIELLQTTFSKNEDEDTKTMKFFFNLPELLLTNKFITLEEPLSLSVPEYFEEKVNELGEIIEKFDAISPHSQSPDFPIRPFPTHITCYSHCRRTTVITILAAFKESIRFTRPQLSLVSPDKIVLGIIGFRPIYFDIIEEKTADPQLLITMPVLTSKMFFDLILQHPDFVPHAEIITSFSDTYFTANKSRPTPELLNLLTTKMNLIRQVYGSENSIQMTHLAEAVFTDTYHLASITNDDVLKLPLNYGLNIVITGPVSSGKRTYAKKYITKHSSAQDLILYSSCFNETLSLTMMDNLRFIARGIYGPPETKKIFLVLFDFQQAIPSVVEFVNALLLHRSIYSKQEDRYVQVERIHLILTTTDIQPIYRLNCPFFLIDQFESQAIDFEQLKCNAINPEMAVLIQKMIIDEKLFYLAQKFISLMHAPLDSSYESESDRFFALFSLFFSEDNLLKIAQICNVPMTQIKHIQCHNNNIANQMHDVNLCSRIIEVINMGYNAILINTDTQIFQFIKNTEFVVLNTHFRTQLFAAMVKVSQNKKRTTFLLDMNSLTIPEVFNILDFFLFNTEAPESSMIFEAADLQIFKHYMDPRGEDRDVFSKLVSLVSFIIICDETEYKLIPQLFLNKMVTIRDQNCEDISIKISERAPFVDALCPYVSLDQRTFNEMVVAKSKKYRERFQEFVDETQFIIEFFSTLTSMRPKIENQTVIATNESESELQGRIEQLQVKLDDAKNKKGEFEDQMKSKANDLSVLQAKVSVQAPNEVSAAIAALCSYSLEEQVEQINQWISKKDDFYIFVNIFKDLFHFITPANFTDATANSPYCKLITAIRQYNLQDGNAMLEQKLNKLGLTGDSPAAEILGRITAIEHNQIPTISSLPIINAMLAWLSVVVKLCAWEEEMNDVSASLTQLKNRNNTNEERINELQQEYDEAVSISVQKAGGMEIPTWLMNAWSKDQEDVHKLMNQLDLCTKLLMRVISSSCNSEKLLSAYSALSIAYDYGFCQLSPAKRKEFFETCKMDHLFNPLVFVYRTLEIELFCPVEKLINLFSPDLESPTMQIFNTLPVFDQMMFSKIIPQSPRFFATKIEESSPLLMHPIKVFFDPNDVALQTLVTTFPDAEVAFSSSKIAKHLFNAITDGVTLIVHIDSVDSGYDFFSTVLHFILHINSTKQIQFEETNKPINNKFQMFCLTKINPSSFKDVSQKDVVFADMTIPELHETQWYEFAAVFAVNPQIQDLFISLLGSITQKAGDMLACIKRLSELSKDTWPEYFENKQKQISLRSLLDSMTSSQETLDSSLATFKSLTEANSEHPQAITRYSQFVSLCRSLAVELGEKYSAYQVISSIRNFTIGKERGSMAPLSAINTFQEMLFDVINCLPCKKRLIFQAKFESNFLKGVASNTHLLFDSSFPKLSERPIGPLMPQLISHVASRFPTIPRQFFTFVTPDTIPFPKDRPVIVVVDPTIPTDFYSRSISQHLPQKHVMMLTIGSFSNQGLSTPEAFSNIVKGCKSKKALFLINFDELIPTYTINAVLHYAHVSKFVNFYIVISEKLFEEKLPLIPNAIVVKVAKPYTVSGGNRIISLFPSFRAESMRYEIPILYLLLLLSHRNDFILKYHQVLPFAMMTRELWSSGQFVNPIARQFWMNVLSTLSKTSTSNHVVQLSYEAVLGYFFKENTPTIPGLQRVEFGNDTILSSEFPPNPPEIGRVIDEDEGYFPRKSFGWSKKLQLLNGGEDNHHKFVIGDFPDALRVIHNVELVNARINLKNNEITVAGQKFFDISVYEKVENNEEEEEDDNESQSSNDTSNNEKGKKKEKVDDLKAIDEKLHNVPILDGEDVIGYIKLKRPGNDETWQMVGVKVILPNFKTTGNLGSENNPNNTSFDEEEEKDKGNEVSAEEIKE